MSVRIMSAVWERSHAEGTARLVLLAIADHAADDGVAWPGVARVARKCLLDERTVRRAVAELVSLGELARRIGGKGPGDTNVYTVTLPGLDHVDNLSKGGQVVPHSKGGEGGQDSRLRGAGLVNKGGGTSSESSLTVKEPRHTPVVSPADQPAPDPVEVVSEVSAIRLRAGLRRDDDG